jgi:hypothetical protein
MLLAELAECRVDGGILLVGGPAVHNSAWTEPLLERGVLWVVRVLRLFLGFEVAEITEELVEAVNGREKLVAVA